MFRKTLTWWKLSLNDLFSSTIGKYSTSKFAKKFSIEGLDTLQIDKNSTVLVFHVSIWAAWSFVSEAKPLRGDGTELIPMTALNPTCNKIRWASIFQLLAIVTIIPYMYCLIGDYFGCLLYCVTEHTLIHDSHAVYVLCRSAQKCYYFCGKVVPYLCAAWDPAMMNVDLFPEQLELMSGKKGTSTYSTWTVNFFRICTSKNRDFNVTQPPFGL